MLSSKYMHQSQWKQVKHEQMSKNCHGVCVCRLLQDGVAQGYQLSGFLNLVCSHKDSFDE